MFANVSVSSLEVFAERSKGGATHDNEITHFDSRIELPRHHRNSGVGGWPYALDD